MILESKKINIKGERSHYRAENGQKTHPFRANLDSEFAYSSWEASLKFNFLNLFNKLKQ